MLGTSPASLLHPHGDIFKICFEKESELEIAIHACSRAQSYGLKLETCKRRIFLGEEKSLEAARSKGGVFNPCDTSNGLILESSLHSAFDAFQWCMDKFLNVHVTEVGKANGIAKYEGQQLNLQIGVTPYPTKQMLRVRFDLFEKIVQDRQSSTPNRKRGRRRFVDAFTV